MSNKTTKRISFVAAAIMLIGIVAAFAPAKVSAAGVTVKNLTITSSQKMSFSGVTRPTVYEEDKVHYLKGTISGLSGKEKTLKINLVSLTSNYKTSNTITLNGQKTYTLNEKLQTNSWGNIWSNDYKITFEIDGKTVGSPFNFTSLRRGYVQFIKDLYGFIGQNVTGINQDSYELSIGRLTPEGVARRYFSYSNFQAVARSLSSKDYAKRLYRAILGREYDQGGLDYWVNCLNAGQPKDQVKECFINSEEFRTRLFYKYL